MSVKRLLVLAALGAGCRSGDRAAPRSCEPTTIVVHEVGRSGIAELDFSCTGGGDPLEATVRFDGATLLALVSPQSGSSRRVGPRAALVAPLGKNDGESGTIALDLDPTSHTIEGEVHAASPKLSGAFRGAYRLVCRVPASVLNVQQRGVWMPGSESFVDDTELRTDFCTRFAALR